MPPPASKRALKVLKSVISVSADAEALGTIPSSTARLAASIVRVRGTCVRMTAPDRRVLPVMMMNTTVTPVTASLVTAR